MGPLGIHGEDPASDMWAPGMLPRPHQALSLPGSSPAPATLFLQPEPLPPPAAADTPAPPAAPETVRPPPAWPCLWNQSLAVGFTPAALPLGQDTTHPQAGGHRPSGQCPQTAQPSSRVCSSVPCLCPTSGALPAPHHLLPLQALLLCPGHTADWEDRAGPEHKG